MSNLESDHPEVKKQFDLGFHVIWRSNRLWGGLPSDLIIEQVLMRSLKTSGGLTRESGMAEQQRQLWVLSMPACADVNHAMQEFTDVIYNTGEQNKGMTKARQSCDCKDTLAVLQYIEEQNPFSNDPSLWNIATEVHVRPAVRPKKTHK